MITYLVLALAFCAAGILVSLAIARSSLSRSTWGTLLTLVIATVVGDNLIVAAGIVQYDPSKILQIFIGVAPVEDFAYSVIAAILIPAVWTALKRLER